MLSSCAFYFSSLFWMKINCLIVQYPFSARWNSCPRWRGSLGWRARRDRQLLVLVSLLRYHHSGQNNPIRESMKNNFQIQILLTSIKMTSQSQESQLYKRIRKKSRPEYKKNLMIMKTHLKLQNSSILKIIKLVKWSNNKQISNCFKNNWIRMERNRP